MIAIPAIDLRDGCCVQLVGGSFGDERLRIADPLRVARRWSDAGFERLHIVDLDAALGTGSNHDVVRSLVDAGSVETQVGGGVRSSEALDDLFRRGVDRAVVGTRALKDRQWLREVSAKWPGRLIVAADSRDGGIVTDGWTSPPGERTMDVVAALNDFPLAGVLVTAVDREGRMGGPDLDLVGRTVATSAHPITASGGVATIQDLRALADAGVAACVIGMALYTGALDEREVAREFAA
jgi:phosphoribosylformimino-5-aminoimidazole carboxamide ribotide isomerase